MASSTAGTPTPLQFCRFFLPDRGARLGMVVGSDVVDLSASGQPHLASLAALLRHSVSEPLVRVLQSAVTDGLPRFRFADLNRSPAVDMPHLLPPVDLQEVWAAGVTYAWSREARVREALAKDIYVRVYDAERPELFFKALPQKVVGPNDWVGLRADSHWNVPEPEVALMLNPKLDIVGITIGNDMSSREIEGENPLYLPQAKIYRHSCALGPVVSVLEPSLDPRNLLISLAVRRGSETIFEGTTTTSKLHRELIELASYLGRADDYPDGAILLTGTGIVPGDDFSLQDGDVVTIDVEGIGRLVNTVRQMA
ncbi:MAG: fumarylacetoacetate hydrolase family protein [Herpetosiphon sp.]